MLNGHQLDLFTSFKIVLVSAESRHKCILDADITHTHIL